MARGALSCLFCGTLESRAALLCDSGTHGGYLPAPAASLQLAADQLWAPAGHEVQTVQLPLSGLLPLQERPVPERPQLQDLPPLTVQADDGSVCISSAAGWSLRFSQAAGGLVGWTDGSGRQLLAAPLSLCIYRAPTDNDRGGSGGSSYTARWVGWVWGGLGAAVVMCRGRARVLASCQPMSPRKQTVLRATLC